MNAMSTRAIGRAAVRDELGSIGLRCFLESGFDAVTFEDLAGRAGVSRSTFLRYFGSKEDVVLHVFDPLGEQMAHALRERPDSEDTWTALRHAVRPAVTLIEDDPATGLARLDLVWSTPALWARLHEKQATWRAGLAALLVERAAGSQLRRIAVQTLVMAALGCVIVAYDGWVESGGAERLGDLVEDAFAALAPGTLR
ncbi:TetR family transcriptional regulator [Curtobacterium sp. MCPF17_047]|uniref:acyl-CoA-like ligand-binding transcription factor n=2 Tax=Curtobacterium TaxID=2034 RepID=UPI000DA95839|nr:MULTISPECIES: TetR family transcriptional regulator [unclassified Curtobacterium]PZE62825.1 TetR family transcriptional regulator [Curtobacterium sp. MCPF17_001]PZF65611.1 TetR family transcriptional regulator [Curtobacterium sp. MCPF17_047]